MTNFVKGLGYLGVDILHDEDDRKALKHPINTFLMMDTREETKIIFGMS